MLWVASVATSVVSRSVCDSGTVTTVVLRERVKHCARCDRSISVHGRAGGQMGRQMKQRLRSSRLDEGPRIGDPSPSTARRAVLRHLQHNLPPRMPGRDQFLRLLRPLQR